MNKKALVIGGAGFVGGYLIDYLHEKCKWSICATKMSFETMSSEYAEIRDLDILDYDACVALLEEVKPDYIFHLAAQSSVATAWKHPKMTVDVNINGTINVLDAIRELEFNPNILLIGSSEEYGGCNSENGIIDEEHSLKPNNIYAMTKVAQEMTGRIYAQAYHMNVVMVRAFNHIGPKQVPLFVVSDFCKQVAEIEKGIRKPVMRVGNLSVKRDFTDVRDVVRAYGMIIQEGVAGEVYNVGSARAIEINEILQTILSCSESEISVEVDPERLRPVDTPVIKADTEKLRTVTDWIPEYSVEDTVKDTLQYWRKQ